MADDVTISTARHCIRLEGELGEFRPEWSTLAIDKDCDVVTLRLAAKKAQVPSPIRLVWAHPTIDIQGRWHPGLKRDRGLPPDWASKFQTRMIHAAPLVSLYNLNGDNRLTFACSEVTDPVEIQCGVHEETAEFACAIGLFGHTHQPIRQYEVSVLIDTRAVPYYEAIRDVGEWWEKDGGYKPLAGPDASRLPLYSTWYSFHQSLDSDRLVRQCELARELGCEAVIVDDGWQTTDSHRGYGYCGDWEPVRWPDMADLVRRVHEIGMKFLLWYGTPFAGKHSAVYQRFAGKQIEYVEGAETGILDPRYPEVRAYLLDTFETAMRDWDLDGFKLDFVDFFDQLKVKDTAVGMDIPDMAMAADRLFTELLSRLQAVKPDVMIEFRQPYVGPVMRQYANMLRSFDCPNDAVTNRINTTDLRLFCGHTAIHSDMFMWNNEDPPESAALQLINVLFTVPQVSVLIDTLSRPHMEMLRFWLRFWREHRDVLLDGKFSPQSPESLYPVITASNDRKRIVVIYGDAVAPIEADVPDELIVVNGSRRERVVVDLPASLRGRQSEVLDCRGWLVRKGEVDLDSGVQALDVPPAGLIRITINR